MQSVLGLNTEEARNVDREMEQIYFSLIIPSQKYIQKKKDVKVKFTW